MEGRFAWVSGVTGFGYATFGVGTSCGCFSQRQELGPHLHTVTTKRHVGSVCAVKLLYFQVLRDYSESSIV